MNILHLSPYIPSEDAHNAGGVCMAMEIQELKKRHHVVSVFFDQSSCGQTPTKEIIPIRISKKDKIKNVLEHPFTANQFATRNSRTFEKAICNVIRENNIDAAHIEYAVMGQYIATIKKINPRIKCNLVLHDVTLQSYYRQIDDEKNPIKKMYLCIQSTLIRRQENFYVSQADDILVFSKKDADLVKKWYGKNTKVISTYFDVERRIAKGKKRDYSDTERAICFFGQLARDENTQAALRLAHIVAQSRENIKLYIIGSNPPKQLKELESEKIIVTGFVDDPDEIICRCRIAVFPLMVGAGIKIKVLHCMALGIPIVTSTIGAEGIDEEGRIIRLATTDDEYLEAIKSLIDNHEIQKKIGKSGIDLIENNFSWSVTSNLFNNIYKSVERYSTGE